MNNKAQVIAALSGPLGILCFFLAYSPMAANFGPPPSMALNAQEIADIYRGNATGICLGAVFNILASGCFIFFACGISAQMRPMEGALPTLTYAQLAGGLLVGAAFAPGAIAMGVGAFRVNRSPAEIQLMNDLAWISYMLPFANNVLQSLAVAFAVFFDKSPRPIFPRWIGYFSFLLAIAFFPSAFILFYKSGPFAVDGPVNFWLGGVGFIVWVVVMCVALLRALHRQNLATRG